MIKLGSLVMLASCVGGDVESEAVQASIADDEAVCPSWGCSRNSPIMGDGLVFDGLDRRFGIPAESGIKILAVTAPDGRPAELEVQGHTLRAYSIDGSNLLYEGGGLEETVVTLQTDSHTYELKITRFEQAGIQFWAPPDEHVPFYEMKARRLEPSDPKEFVHICVDTRFETDPDWSGVGHLALVFEGDHYDARNKLVYETPNDPRFNLTCAGTAPAKLHLLRHTAAGSRDIAPLVHTSVEQRQAMLKMITADFCGDGTPYTVHGVPLWYQDVQALHVLPAAAYADPARIEAIWTQDGAQCIDRPRYYKRGLIPCTQTLPSCVDFVDWDQRGLVISVAPPTRPFAPPRPVPATYP
jgi:hypothetical protein